MSVSDADFMLQALQCAQLAEQAGEVPVGALLVRGDTVLARGFNRPIVVVRSDRACRNRSAAASAARALDSYRLTGTTLYVTLEPCPMCAAALVHARVRRVVFGAFDPQAGGAGSQIDLFRLPGLNHRVDVFGGVRERGMQRPTARFLRAQANSLAGLSHAVAGGEQVSVDVGRRRCLPATPFEHGQILPT